MFNHHNRRFAFQFQGGPGNGEDWTPPWLHQERQRWERGPRLFARRMRRNFFGQGGPFGPEGPFGGPGQRFFGRGDMKYALLELLQVRPMHGYEMMKALEERSGGFYTPSAGSIYPTLQMLEDRGLVSVNEVEGKKIYSITDAGRAFLGERHKEDEEINPPWERFFNEGRRRWNEPEIQAVRTEAMEVARLFTIAGRMSFHDPEKLLRLRGIIERSRKELSDMIYGSSSQPNPESKQAPSEPPTGD